MRHAPVFAAVVAALAVGFAGSGASQAPRPPGYLTSPINGVLLLGSPPAPGSAEDLAEKADYADLGERVNSPRWAQAAIDAELSPQTLSRGFGCAAGVAISPETTPRLTEIMTRVGTDIRKTVQPPKDHFKRVRPAVGNDAPICVARDPALLADGSYPSGHAMLGWVYALILAELKPTEADPILLRGKAFGDSRVICGVHHMSDVEAGRELASALVARLHGEPLFIADMAMARSEVMKAPAPENCPKG